MAFATKLVAMEIGLDACKPLLTSKYRRNREKIWDLIKPTLKEVVIKSPTKEVKIGGEYVMYRHELTYINPTAIAIDVTDDLPKDELIERVKKIENFSYSYIGKELKLNLVAVRSVTEDPEKFGETVKTVVKNTSLPMILCTFNPKVMKSGLSEAKNSKPLIYAATKDNWDKMGELASMYNCPLTIFAPNDITLLKSLVKTMKEYGIEDLVLDPGTFPGDGVSATLNNFTMIRRAAFKENDELLSFPLIGTPITAWTQEGRILDKKWEETYLAGMLIVRFADALIVHNLEGWSLLPQIILRENIYTDPRKPVAVEPGIRMFGQPNENSPVLFTTNFALTYYTVAADIQSAKLDCYLLVVDTEGLSVDSAVAGRKLTADRVADSIKESKIEEKVKHRKIVIPGRASRLSGEIEEKSGWKVLVGPLDSSGIPKFMQEKWK